MAKRIGTGALAETSLYRLRWLAENWRGMGPQRAAGGDCFCSSQYGHGDRYALPSHSEPQTRRRACPYCPGLHSSPRTAETTLIVRLVQNSALTSVTAVRSRPSPALEQFYKQVRSRTPELVRFSRVSVARRAQPHPNETLCLRSSPDATVPASAPRFELVLQRQDVSDPKTVARAGPESGPGCCRLVASNRSQGSAPKQPAHAPSGSGTAQGFARLRKTPADELLKSGTTGARSGEHRYRGQRQRRTRANLRSRAPREVPGRRAPRMAPTDTQP